MESLVVALALAAPMAAFNNVANAGTRVGRRIRETKKYSCFAALLALPDHTSEDLCFLSIL